MDMFAVVRQRPVYVYSRGERQLIRQIGVVGGCLRTDIPIVVREIPDYRYTYSRDGNTLRRYANKLHPTAGGHRLQRIPAFNKNTEIRSGYTLRSVGIYIYDFMLIEKSAYNERIVKQTTWF